MTTKVLKIAKAELQKMFYSPIAWISLIVFIVQCGYGFVGAVGYVDYYMEKQMSLSCLFLNDFGGIFTTLYNYIYLYVPLLTMGLISEELRNKNINLLYAAPVSNAQIILGKYLAILTYGLLLMGVVCIFIVFGAIAVQNFEWGVALSGLLGVFLMFVTYSAIGLFVSSLTSYPIVAAIGSFIVLGALSKVNTLWQEYEFFRDITWWLSINGRAWELIRGLVCSEDVLYFIILSVTFVWLTIIRLNAIRQKVKFTVTLGKNMAVIVVACLLGYVTSRPGLMFYHDASDTDYNTLSPGSLEVLADLQGEVTITTYRNLLNLQGWESGSSFVNENKERFRQYVRFNPRIRFKDVYYYDTVLTRYNKMLTAEQWNERLEYAVESHRVKKYLNPQEIRKQLDLDREGKGFVWKLRNEENGRETCLRIYNDLWKFPFEIEITSALRRLVTPPVMVGVVEGFGGRSIYDATKGGLFYVAYDTKTRNALINKGFEVLPIDLSQPIADSIDILVIADLQTSLTEEADRHLQEYIDRGGNLYVTGEPRRQEIMNPIFEKFGFELTPGVLVKIDSVLLPDRLPSHVTKEAVALNHWFTPSFINDWIGQYASTGLLQKSDMGYEVIPLFRTDSVGVWNEVETAYITEEHPVVFNPEAGEKMGAYTTLAALRRTVNGKEQRIILSGDTEFLSDRFVLEGGVLATNNNLVWPAPFSWLSYEESPIDTRRPALRDLEFKLDIGNSKIFARVMQYGVPGVLLVVFLLLLFRRRGR